MTAPSSSSRFTSQLDLSQLAFRELHQYNTTTDRSLTDAVKATRQSLNNPIDFPPVSAAIAPGDRIALAVDPYVPQLAEVLSAVISELSQTECEGIDIVLWDEASDETLLELQKVFGASNQVIRHDSEKRNSLRYVGVDLDDEPIYINRFLVDADFILPIVTMRPLDAHRQRESGGVFPVFADSNSRIRYQKSLLLESVFPKSELQNGNVSNDSQIGWLLGVQVVLAVHPSREHAVGEVRAGTPLAMEKWFGRARKPGDDFPPPAPLVIASIEGTAQQHTWENVARAAYAASAYTSAGGTIFLWTELKEQPTDRLIGRLIAGDDEIEEADSADELGLPTQTDDGFTHWDPSLEIARVFLRVRSEHRLLLYSQLDGDFVESLGIGHVASGEAMNRLSQSFETCGILTSAQFAGGTFADSIEQFGENHE